jgi:hypothetical protein
MAFIATFRGGGVFISNAMPGRSEESMGLGSAFTGREEKWEGMVRKRVKKKADVAKRQGLKLHV